MNKTKTAIFDAAIKVFSSYGYTGATMDEIVTSAGVAKGSLYYHFKNKEELFNFIVDEGVNLILENVEQATKDIENPLEKIEISARVQLKYVYHNKDLIKLIISQLWGTEERNNFIRRKINLLLEKSTDHIQQAMDEGLIEKDDAAFSSHTFMGMLFSFALYELLNEENYDYNHVIDKFLVLLKSGIRIKNPTF